MKFTKMAISLGPMVVYTFNIPVIISGNILICKIVHFCIISCVILTTLMRNSHLLNRIEIMDVKFAHFA